MQCDIVLKDLSALIVRVITIKQQLGIISAGGGGALNHVKFGS